MKMDRPNVYVYVTASLDGRIALSPDATLYNPNNVNLDKYPQFHNLFGDSKAFESEIKEDLTV